MTASRLQTERDKAFAENQEKMMGILQDLQVKMTRFSCQFDMRKDVDIKKYFPIKSLQDISRFLDKGDGLFQKRRDEFEDFLYCNVTNTKKLKRPFETTLLSTLFSRDFITSHKWPGPKYKKNLKLIYMCCILKICYLISSVDAADLDITVPDEFSVILRIALSKMVAAKSLNPEFINLDFWRQIPNKFRGIRLYEATKNKIREVYIISL